MDPSTNSMFSKHLLQGHLDIGQESNQAKGQVTSSDSQPVATTLNLNGKITDLNLSKTDLIDKIKEKFRAIVGMPPKAIALSAQEEEQKTAIVSTYQKLCECEIRIKQLQHQIGGLEVREDAFSKKNLESFKAKLVLVVRDYEQLNGHIMDLKAKVAGTKVMSSIRFDHRDSGNPQALKHSKDFEAVSYRIQQAISQKTITSS